MPRRSGFALLAGLVVLSTTCGRDSGTEPLVPTTVTVAPGAIALAAIGASQALTATVRDQRGNALTSQGIAWSSNNTSVATVTSSGVVTAVANGSATIRAAVGSVQGTATVTVAQTASALVKASGDAQTGPVDAALPSPLVVRANDANGHPVAGVAVTLAVSAGGGSLSATSRTTGPDGQTAGVTWTLGRAAGAAQQVSASAAGVAPVTFTATAMAGTAAQLALGTGDGQTGVVNTPVAVNPSVVVRDQFDNPVQGVAVTFTVTAGGGSVAGGNATTDANGVAAVSSWTLGTMAGTDNNRLEATAAGLPGSPVTFTATAAAGAATQIALNAGDNQTAEVGSAVLVPPSVLVSDQFGNPVDGLAVSFVVTAGGGSVAGGNATSDATGLAAVTSWTLGTMSGAANNTLEARATGLAGSPITFAASATPAAATQMALHAGDGQTATVNTAVAIAPAVLVTDQFDNPVPGIAVTFTVTAGGGSVVGGNATTGIAGVAAVTSWTLGTVAGTDNNTLQATAPGLTGSPVTFTASATPGAAVQVALHAGDNQTATVNTAVAIPPSVLVRDQFNNSVPGVGVTFTVKAGGGSVAGGSTATDGAGIAAVTSWTLGTVAGIDNNMLEAAVPGLAGSPVTFTASATAGAPTQMALNAGDNQTATVNTAVPISPSVRVRDQFDNPVPGVAVTFTVTAGGGSVAGGNATTGANGVAAVASWTLGTMAGTDNNTLQAAAPGLAGSPVAFTASAVAGAASRIMLDAGDNQTAQVNTAVAIAPSVRVEDQFSNPVPGVAVTFAVTVGGGSVSGGNATTDAAGVAAVTSWTLGTMAGTGNHTLEATAAGLAGSPVVFSASATPAAASRISKAAGDAQSATVGTSVPIPPTALVTDQFGNPVSGVAVTFAIVSGAGSISGSDAVSGVDGLAAVGSWTLGSLPGPNSLTATATGLIGSPLTFTATGVSGAAKNIALSAGDAQTDTVGATLPVDYAVLVTDSLGNPVAGITVGWAVTGGGGSITPTSPGTDATGIATASRTLGTGVGTQTATASVGGLTGSPVQFTATATAGTATQMTLAAGDNQAATVNTTVAVAPSALVRDQFDNPVQGIAVTFAVTAGGGSVAGGNATTDANGVAAVANWTLGTVAGVDNNSLEATSTGLTGSPLTFTASATAGPAASVAVQAGDGQTGPAGMALPVGPAVIVRDAFTNPVPDAIVTFAVTGGGGSVTGPVDTTGADGIATVGEWILGVPGANELMATVAGSGISGNPVTFTATATGAGTPATVALFAGDNQTGLVGFAVNVPPAVIVLDGTSAPVPNVQVDFSVTGGGGSVTGGSVLTGPDGVAQVGSWALGTSPGPNSLSATVAAGGVSGNPVTFSATGATNQYNIVLRFLTAVSAAAQEAFDSAEARWERMLYGDLTNIPINRSAGTCAGVSVPAINETVDDLLIFVRLDSIDGPFNVLGRAGPCLIRGSDSLPVVGAMRFDTADVATFVSRGLFDEIVMHEMGHVIGFGTLWSLKGRLQNPSLFGGADPFFNGPEAIAAFDRSGGTGYSGGAKVPVENTGGSGTADSHWRESVFDTELMTGFLDAGVANPLSVISVASLADLGYFRANYAAADAYVVASALLRIGAAQDVSLGGDAYEGVVTFVDAQGRPRGTVRLRE